MEKSLQMEMALSQNYLKPHELQKVYLMLKLKQPHIETKRKRLPLNVSFVLDRSSSIQGAKLDFTKKAVNFAIDNLDSTDMCSVVVFDDQIDVIVPPQKQKAKLYELQKFLQDEEILEEINNIEENYKIMEEKNYTSHNRKKMKYTTFVTNRKR